MVYRPKCKEKAKLVVTTRSLAPNFVIDAKIKSMMKQKLKRDDDEMPSHPSLAQSLFCFFLLLFFFMWKNAFRVTFDLSQIVHSCFVFIAPNNGLLERFILKRIKVTTLLRAASLISFVAGGQVFVLPNWLFALLTPFLFSFTFRRY